MVLVAVVLLSGVGVQPPGLVVRPSLVDFGERPLLSVTRATVTVTNLGSAPVPVVPAAQKDFGIVGSGCAGTLQGNASCTIVLSFTPQAPGERHGTLGITATTTVPLRGRGSTPVVTAEPGVVTAGRVLLLRGKGFPVDHPVSVATADGSVSAPPLTTDALGRFRESVVVFEHASAGPAVVVVSAQGTGFAASVPVLVVADTYQPPGFQTRR